jgi:hypothetical protein
MSFHKIHGSKTMNQCIESIDNIAKSCEKKFTPKVCKNIHHYYLNYCYNKFENKETCSSVSTLGANTLNLSTKSPPPPL